MCWGGNDIIVSFIFKKIYEDIINLVNLLENKGVKIVNVCEIVIREKFGKLLGFDKKMFDKKRKLINNEFRKKFG